MNDNYKCDIYELERIAIELDKKLSLDIPNDLVGVTIEPNTDDDSYGFGIFVHILNESAKKYIPKKFKKKTIRFKVVTPPRFAKFA